MNEPVTVTGSVWVDESDLHWRFSRSSGPGGQGVNTTDSRVELSVSLTDVAGLSEAQLDRARTRLANRLIDDVVTIAASQYRSQLRNRQAARERLAVLLREAIAPDPKKRRPTKPSKRAKQRRLNAKRQRGEVKRLRRSVDD